MANADLPPSKVQKFGGLWSLLKLEVVEAYLKRFTTALSKQTFTRVYIDAFAGSGSFTFGEDELGGFFPKSTEVHAGSATRALAVTPIFHELHFIDNKADNVGALKSVIGDRAGALIWQGDANTVVRDICAKTDWRGRRGVIFLDPFGTAVEWETLEAIAKTQALDIWYLCPLAGVFRNAPHDHADLTDDKRRAVTRIVGTPDWEAAFYKKSPPRSSLFDEPEGAARRVLDVDGIERFMTERLKTVFPHVEPPRRLSGPKRAPLFSLFFAMSNPSPAAKKVALPIARHLLKARD